jgi:hypothetical protein
MAARVYAFDDDTVEEEALQQSMSPGAPGGIISRSPQTRVSGGFMKPIPESQNEPDNSRDHSKATVNGIAVVSFAELKRKLLWILREILYTGNMPNAQEYLYKHSFFHFEGQDAQSSNGLFIQLLSTILVVVDIILRGIAQVFLCNNPISGIFICAGLAHTSTRLLVYAIIGTAASSLSGVLLTLPPLTEVASGLLG